MARMNTVSDLEQKTTADPRSRSEEEWLDVFEHLLGSLCSVTCAEIEVGAYWLDSMSALASASLGARIRAEGPLLWTNSDYWEAAFCITGNAAGSYIDVFAFPFLRGCVINRDGPLDDIARDDEVEEFWLQFANGTWIERGWNYPEGTGEWDYVRRPGTAFFRAIRCQGTKERFCRSEPLLVTVDRAEDRRNSLGGRASLSIHRLLRDDIEIVMPPSAVSIPRPGSQQRPHLGSTMLPATFPVDSISIPGGWIPARYQLEVRLHWNSAPTSCDSDISNPIRFEVIP